MTRRDPLDSATRSRVMKSVKSKNTGLELRFRRALWAAGVRGWRCHVRAIAGTPDLAWAGRKVAVFIDSAWWHGHPSRWAPGRHGEFWDKKIMANRRRDEIVNEDLGERGWTVLRIWYFEIEQNAQSCVSRVKDVLRRTR